MIAEVGALPPQCRFVPITPTEAVGQVRLCAVVQQGPQSSLILLGSSWLGRAYLGAVVDASNQLHAWLELWVQSAGERTVLGEREAGTNPEIDARWKRWAGSLAGDAMSVATGWETTQPHPVWLDVEKAQAVVPRDARSGECYDLCTDDAALMVGVLDSFSDSACRFLAVKGQPGAGFLTSMADIPSGARGASEMLPGAGRGMIPFNPEAGFLLVRRLAPLEWEAYAGLLSGRSFRGLSAGRPPVKLGGPYAALDDWDRLQQNGAYLFSSSRGRAGRFNETFHLKLLLLQSMLREVRAAVASTQLPFLNLGPATFRVDLSPQGGALPVLWTARAVLSEPAATLALSTAGELRYFKSVAGFDASIFRPEGAGRAARGRGDLRLRKVMTSGGRTQVEATVVSPVISAASPRDLVSARLPLPGAGSIDLVGNIDAAEALTQGEARFRTAPLTLSPAIQSALSGLEGGVFPGTPFETIPLLSTPVDLFALGVLGAQLFLTGSGKALPTALDELLSMTRAVGTEGKPGERFQALAASDARWSQSLGPQHHGHGVATSDEAAGMLPVELWWDTLATLGRFFAGSSIHAFCRDFGDAPAYQLDAAFDAPLAALDALVLRSQSLLLCDWPSNREIARVIQKVR